MPSKDQDAFDITFVRDSIDTFAESVEAHFENVARSLQDAFRQTPWLPDAVKPRQPPSSRGAPMIRPPVGYFEASKNWILEHQAVTAAVVAFVGTGFFIVWRRRRADRAKRRAKRAKSGARTEVVILSGSPLSPLTRSLSLDLERRGFIVYIPAGTLSEEQIIQAISRSDIRPLSLDITSPSATGETIQKLHRHLTTPQHAIAHTAPHILSLTAFIHIPSSDHTPSPISTMSPSHWSNVLTTHLLAPFTTINAFLPLLVSQQSTLLFLTPSITSFLAPPDHATESVVAGGMSQYIATIRHEISNQGVSVSELKLGHFDLGPSAADKDHSSGLGQGQVAMRFHHPTRADLTKQRLQSAARGTHVRRLHNAIFDVIERRKGVNGTTFVGRGARTYDLVGRWVPQGIVGWMMGAAGAPVGVEAVDKKEDAGMSSSKSSNGNGAEGGNGDGSVEWEKVEEGSGSP